MKSGKPPPKIVWTMVGPSTGRRVVERHPDAHREYGSGIEDDVVSREASRIVMVPKIMPVTQMISFLILNLPLK